MHQVENFGESYAALYDRIYQDKNYDAECAFLAELLARHSSAPAPWSVVDFGCGTGNHSLRLAAMGINVLGVDRSQSMLAFAGIKAKTTQGRIEFSNELPPEGRFDAVFSLFDVINYFPSKKDCTEYLRQFNRQIHAQGFVAVETWNGVAVPFLTERAKSKRISGTPELIRESRTELDWKNQILDVSFTCSEAHTGRELVRESHPMKYYTVTELTEMAENANLAVSAIYRAYTWDAPKVDDFKLMYVLKKRS